MASLLLRHLASSLSRQVAQMSRINLTAPAASAYRCLHTLTASPCSLLPSSARVCSVRVPPISCCAQGGSSLLGQHLPGVQPSSGMKTKSALRRRCKDCFFVVRRGRLYVYCKVNPRHKQRQG